MGSVFKRRGFRILLVCLAAFLLGVVADRVVLVVQNVRVFEQWDRCKAHQIQIRNALQRHAKSGDGSLPATLSELVEEGLAIEDMLRCPTSGKRYTYLFEGLPVKWDDLPWNTPLLACPGLEHGICMTRRGFRSRLRADVIRDLEAGRATWAEALVPGGGEFLKRHLESGATSSSSDSPEAEAPTAGSPVTSAE